MSSFLFLPPVFLFLSLVSNHWLLFFIKSVQCVYMTETTQPIKLTELTVLAEAVLEQVQDCANPETAAVLALRGDLGAGKTTFVQALAQVLRIPDIVTSPTFTIMKQYIVPQQNAYGIERLVHIDAYRLESSSEVGPLRLAEFFATPHTLVCIEWPEKIADNLPQSTIRLDFKSVSETERLVTITSPNRGV